MAIDHTCDQADDAVPPPVDRASDRIVRAATGLFRSDGFRKTSMDAIAAAAAVSKRTLYQRFSSKHAILEAVLRDFSGGHFDDIARNDASTCAGRARLYAIARGLIRASTQAATVETYRALIAEHEAVPALSIMLHGEARDRTNALVRGPLAELGMDAAAGVGAIMYDLFVLAPLHRCLVGVSNAPDRVEATVDLIVDGAARS